MFREIFEAKEAFTIELKDGDKIHYTVGKKDWMRAYNDEKPLQAFDLEKWDKDKIVQREGKYYKIDKVI